MQNAYLELDPYLLRHNTVLCLVQQKYKHIVFVRRTHFERDSTANLHSTRSNPELFFRSNTVTRALRA